eukprot:COSAG02_NODE_7264_length_3090_cov_6.208960_4_plen_56_part_01
MLDQNFWSDGIYLAPGQEVAATSISTRGKDWGLEEEIDCTLNALEFGRSLLTWGAG